MLRAAEHEITSLDGGRDRSFVELVQPLTMHVQHDGALWCGPPDVRHMLREVLDVHDVGLELSDASECL